MDSDGICTAKHPGNGKRCTKFYGHPGVHTAGPSVLDHWGGRMGRYQPVERRLATPKLSREQIAAKFRDVPGQGAMDMETGEIVYEEE